MNAKNDYGAPIPPAAAEPIFHLGSFPITNTMINAWIAVVFCRLCVYREPYAFLYPRTFTEFC